MKLINNKKNVELIISDELIYKLGLLGVDSFPCECGGFLVGYYSEDMTILYVTDFISPKIQKKSTMSFERSTKLIQDDLYNLFDAKGHYYIGEWHTHPNGSTMYSQTDLSAMKRIEECDTVNIVNPILLILSIKNKKVDGFTIYLYNKKGLYRYE